MTRMRSEKVAHRRIDQFAASYAQPVERKLHRIARGAAGDENCVISDALTQQIRARLFGRCEVDRRKACDQLAVLAGGDIVGTQVFSAGAPVGTTSVAAVFAVAGFTGGGALWDNGGPVQTIALKGETGTWIQE